MKGASAAQAYEAGARACVGAQSMQQQVHARTRAAAPEGRGYAALHDAAKADGHLPEQARLRART